MVFAVIVAAVFGAISLYMMMAARFSVTRKMAWIPLSMAVMELAMSGLLLWGEYPVLISHPDPKDVRIDLPLSAAKWIKMVVVGILPLLLIGCGVWVWYKRRGR